MYKLITSKQGRNYVYDSISNNFYELDDESVKKLPVSEGETQLLRDMDVELWNSVYGEYNTNQLREYSVSTSEDENPEILILELTQQCNLRCKYCIYSGEYFHERGHQDIHMNEDMMDVIYNTYFSETHSPEYISFYGGEPLLRFDLIQYIIKKVKTGGYDTNFAMTTNGLLLEKDEILQFLMSNKVRLNISFDGVNHDLYRKLQNGDCTSNRILKVLEKINELSEKYFIEYISLSITLTPPYSLMENARYFNSDPMLSKLQYSVNMVNDTDTTFFKNFDMKYEKKQLAEEYHILADEYIEKIKLLPFHKALFSKTMLRIDSRIMELQKENYPKGQCEVGKHRLFVNAKGNKYMCERVGDFGKLGILEQSEKDMEAYVDVLRDYKEKVLKNCEDCHLIRICNLCMSAFREGCELGTEKRIKSVCENQKKWFDFIFYIYVSKKENGTEF